MIPITSILFLEWLSRDPVRVCQPNYSARGLPGTTTKPITRLRLSCQMRFGRISRSLNLTLARRSAGEAHSGMRFELKKASGSGSLFLFLVDAVDVLLEGHRHGRRLRRGSLYVDAQSRFCGGIDGRISKYRNPGIVLLEIREILKKGFDA